MDNKIEIKKLIISSSPHLLNTDSTKSIMWTVSIFLMPACIFGIYVFGLYAGLVVLVSIISSILAEIISQLARKKKITIDDGSAFLTGLLLGMNMPPSVPLYIPIISSIFAIVIVKQAFGGLGQNWANPAIAGRVFALVAWSKQMTTWQTPFVADSLTTATPLLALKSALLERGGNVNIGPIQLLQSLPSDFLRTETTYLKLFFGYKGGCIGEISIFLLLLAALYLIIRKIITLEIPLSYIGTVAIIAWVFDGTRFGLGFFNGDPLFHILTGGLVLGAFFMATDMVTTPITVKGRIIFGIGCGIITMLIRMFGGLPEGVSLSILFMNMLTPAIDRFIKIKPLGFYPKKE
ncbi:MAG TPA: RnfABCDGE type electron transport complex subunit D [Spirochaetota bacterium]|nr:RnfABCDGE type electron transport complex subunit D [Spirochaetota bacterium]HOL56556.1 RnfABCDGE type electron transport complex subunit D [Spirochaetota bacterium]HPP03981.1 RnfABCDGE type electron transport complex subunit D [Spirochaetota bacterium]